MVMRSELLFLFSKSLLRLSGFEIGSCRAALELKVRDWGSETHGRDLVETNGTAL